MKKWSRLHITIHILAWLPLVVLAAAYLTDNLTINPIQTATQRTGDIAIILLLLSLACTPLNTLFHLPELLKLRRPLGLYAFMYASLHFMIYTGWDYGFEFRLASTNLFEKRYMVVGLAALSLLVPLAITSHNWWKKRLGKAWKNLHRLVYLAAGLVVLHVAWVVKGDLTRLTGDIWKPLAAGIILALFLAARIPASRRWLTRLRGRVRQTARKPSRTVQPLEKPYQN